MTHRSLIVPLFLSFVTACGNKDDDTAGIADEQSEPAGLNSADVGPSSEPGESSGSEANESNDEGSENIDDGSEDEERDDESSDEEETDDGDGVQGGTLSEDTETEEEVGETDESSDGVVAVGAAVLPASLPPSGTSGTLTSYSMEAPSGRIRDLDVKVDLDHSCSKDLAATLTSPSGTTIVLFDMRELVVCSSDMEETLFDDEASVSITRGSTPFRGLHRPTGYLSDFDGEDAAGVWTLSIVDDTIGDKGTLEFWSLKLSVD